MSRKPYTEVEEAILSTTGQGTDRVALRLTMERLKASKPYMEAEVVADHYKQQAIGKLEKAQARGGRGSSILQALSGACWLAIFLASEGGVMKQLV